MAKLRNQYVRRIQVENQRFSTAQLNRHYHVHVVNIRDQAYRLHNRFKVDIQHVPPTNVLVEG